VTLARVEIPRATPPLEAAPAVFEPVEEALAVPLAEADTLVGMTLVMPMLRTMEFFSVGLIVHVYLSVVDETNDLDVLRCADIMNTLDGTVVNETSAVGGRCPQAKI
jgi:hypothetical protein